MKYLKISLIAIISLIIGFSIGYYLTYGSADINRDGKVNALDFSIMMSQWSK